nr:hypothetical protein [Rhodococcus sp. (in: high G+C Gram-positive bacteria)]
MRENSDVAQARVFAALLTAEIDSTTKRVQDAERFVGTAYRVGDTRSRVWHGEQAQSEKQVLYELHRQRDALRNRFPAILDGATTNL